MNVAIIGHPTHRQQYEHHFRSISHSKKKLKSVTFVHLEPGLTADQLAEKHRVKKFKEIVCIGISTAQIGYWAQYFKEKFNRVPFKGINLVESDHHGTKSLRGITFVTTMTIDSLATVRNN